MNRRQALRTTLTMAAAAALRGDLLARQAASPRPAAPGSTLYVSPGGADANAGAKDVPLRSLAEAAKRVNASTGTGAATIVLTEGVHAIGETTWLKPASRAFSRAERLTIRAEVLPVSRLAHRAHANPDPYPADAPNVERPTGFARRRSRWHAD